MRTILHWLLWSFIRSFCDVLTYLILLLRGALVMNDDNRPQIYNSIGLNAQRAALVQNSVLFGSTILCLFLIDRIGRRMLMILGTIGCMSMMLGLSIIFFVSNQNPAAHGL